MSTADATHPAQLDHLVVAARTLAEGVAWCEATLGVVPGPGGEHALFGTHNRLMRLEAPNAPQAYLEIIAINPAATPSRTHGLKRWFDLDDPALQAQLALNGPQLIHWVVSVPSITHVCTALRTCHLDPGTVLEASRPTAQGLLQWQISVRDDGQRLMGGALPTLIQWGNTHPAASMAAPSVRLCSLQLSHPTPAQLEVALHNIGAGDAQVVPGAPGIQVELMTPKGPLTLRSC